MAKSAPETDSGLIIPVLDLKRDQLGTAVANGINNFSDFSGMTSRGFGRPLDDKETFRAAATLNGYFSEMPKEVKSCIAEVRLSLNDYEKKFGIGLVSVNIEMQDEDENLWLPVGELKPPTLGVVKSQLSQNTQVLAGFKVDEGAEQITVLSEKLHARGFLPGENIPETLQAPPYPWNRGQTVTVPQNTMVGLHVPVTNAERFFRLSEIPFRLICDVACKNRPKQVYFCRYLTRKAARKVLGLDYKSEGPGPLAPHWDRDLGTGGY